jgi:hypothetical protein
MGVPSVSQDCEASIVTVSGAEPELGLTESTMVGGWSTRGVGVGVDEAVGLGVGPGVGLVVAVGVPAVRGKASGLASGGGDAAGEGAGATAGVGEGRTSRNLVAPAGLTISGRCEARIDAETSTVKTSATAQTEKTPANISSVMPFRMARVSFPESRVSRDYTQSGPSLVERRS